MVFLPFFRRPHLSSCLRRQLYHLSVTVPKLLSISYSLSGRRDSNSRPIAWKAIALPTELLPQWSEKRDSNSRPQPWQGCALPTELLSLIASPQGFEPWTYWLTANCSTAELRRRNRRGGRIRTYDLLVPNQARYLATLHPDYIHTICQRTPQR